MKIRLLFALAGLAISFVLPSFAQSGEIITFDAPGASATAGLGTFPLDINDLGQAIGWFVGAQNVFHGFVRYADGRFETIDAPGAGTLAGSFHGTIPYSINIHGMIAGQYEDANNVYHGFLREPDGHFVIIDAPAAGTAPGEGTFAVSINAVGETAGNFTPTNDSLFPVGHGFLRSPSGAFTFFDAAPNAVGTTVSTSCGLNALGVTIGTYSDATFKGNGYVRP